MKQRQATCIRRLPVLLSRSSRELPNLEGRSGHVNNPPEDQPTSASSGWLKLFSLGFEALAGSPELQRSRQAV